MCSLGRKIISTVYVCVRVCIYEFSVPEFVVQCAYEMMYSLYCVRMHSIVKNGNGLYFEYGFVVKQNNETSAANVVECM